MRPSRIIVGEVRAEECLDLLLALNAGLPGMCTLHANSAREALVKMCTLPLLAGENISARFVVPTVAASRRPRRAPRHRRRTAYAASTRSSRVPGRVENDVIETEPIFERTGGELRARRRACRPRLERFERLGIDVHQILRGRPLMGALVGLGVGVGLLLVWSAFALPRTPRARAARRHAADSCSRAPGSATSRSPSFVRALRRAAARVAFARRSRSCRGTAAGGAWSFGADGRLPAGRWCSRPARGPAAARVRRGLARGGRQPRQRRARRACRCPTPWPRWASAVPSRCGDAFDAFALDYQVTGRFGECLDRLKDRLADPVGDRVVEGLRIAREVGGGELGRLLRNLSGYLRDDARTRSELESRQAWTVNGARLAVAAPWLVLLLMSLPARRDPPLRLARRRASCSPSARRSACVAYRLMMRIGRLPVERRILS